MSDITFNPKWLLLLGIAGASLVVFDGVIPGAGIAIAAGIALWWTIDTGAVEFVTRGVKRLQKAASL